MLRLVQSNAALLVITGAAATGKSTIGDHLRERPELLVIDGDVLGRGAAATAEGRRDYLGFWRYVLALCGEVRSNGLVPVVPCICLPEQVLAAVDGEVVHFLGLVSEPSTIRRRIADRRGVSDVPSPESHVQFDNTLRGVTVPRPHTWERHDVASTDLPETLAAASALTGGLLVLLATFGVGTENALYTPVMGQTQYCGTAIPTSWLMFGTDYQAQPGSAATDDEKRAATACGPIVHESRVVILTIMGVGGLLALVGWTAISTLRDDVPRTVTHVRA